MENNELRLEAQDLNQQGMMLLKTGNLDTARQSIQNSQNCCWDNCWLNNIRVDLF